MRGGTRWRWAFASLLAALLVADLLFPPPIPALDRGTVVVARNGTPLRTYPSTDGVWRQPVTPDQVSPLYLQALLHYEDRWFHWHPGINPVALARAAWQWIHHGRVVSGGSTITMQVARLIDPSPAKGSRTLAAKLRQIARALQLEMRLNKRDILTLYLNHAPMGGIVEGVEMASRAYLGRSSAYLSHAEAAMLAALPQAPSRLRPDRAPEAARRARDKVLDRLARDRVWTAGQVADAKLERVAVQAIRSQWLAPLAAQRLRQAARGRARQPTIHSTIDVELQSSVERLLLDRAQGLPPKVSIAALVMDNDTLEVHAYAGSADFNDRDRLAHVDMVRGVRSPGSTLKPFLYALALDEGLIHSESLLIDVPQSFAGYQPGNFQASFSGPVSVSEALQRSLNVPAVDLLDRIGPARFAAMLRSGGVQLRLPHGATPNLSVILGGAGTTLEELVGAYRAFARGGLAGRPRLAPQAERVESRLMSAGAAFIVRDILESGGHPERPFLEGGRRMAWKTGTSFGFRDAWSVGVTDQYTVGVWVGRPDGTPNPGFFGANVAAPLLHDIAAALPVGEGAALRGRPRTVDAVTVCWPLGWRVERTPEGACLQRRQAWSLGGAVPPTLPDRTGTAGLLVASTCEPGRQAVRWPQALEPWIPAALRPPCTPTVEVSSLRMRGIEEGARLRRAPGRPDVEIQLEAEGAVAAEPLYWLVDGRQQARTVQRHQVRLRFSADGTHDLAVVDGRGRYHRVRIEVKGG